jgi:hypothetical protein
MFANSIAAKIKIAAKEIGVNVPLRKRMHYKFFLLIIILLQNNQ